MLTLFHYVLTSSTEHVLIVSYQANFGISGVNEVGYVDISPAQNRRKSRILELVNWYFRSEIFFLFCLLNQLGLNVASIFHPRLLFFRSSSADSRRGHLPIRCFRKHFFIIYISNYLFLLDYNNLTVLVPHLFTN